MWVGLLAQVAGLLFLGLCALYDPALRVHMLRVGIAPETSHDQTAASATSSGPPSRVPVGSVTTAARPHGTQVGPRGSAYSSSSRPSCLTWRSVLFVVFWLWIGVCTAVSAPILHRRYEGTAIRIAAASTIGIGFLFAAALWAPLCFAIVQLIFHARLKLQRILAGTDGDAPVVPLPGSGVTTPPKLVASDSRPTVPSAYSVTSPYAKAHRPGYATNDEDTESDAENYFDGLMRRMDVVGRQGGTDVAKGSSISGLATPSNAPGADRPPVLPTREGAFFVPQLEPSPSSPSRSVPRGIASSPPRPPPPLARAVVRDGMPPPPLSWDRGPSSTAPTWQPVTMPPLPAPPLNPLLDTTFYSRSPDAPTGIHPAARDVNRGNIDDSDEDGIAFGELRVPVDQRARDIRAPAASASGFML